MKRGRSERGATMWRVILIASALLASAIAALFVHDFMLEHLGIPYPRRSPGPEWSRLIGTLLRLSGALAFVMSARKLLASIGVLSSMMLIALLVAMIDELLRVIVVNVTLAASDPSHPYLVFALARFAPASVGESILLSFIYPLYRFTGSRPVPLLAGLLAVAVFGSFLLLPGANAVSAHLTGALGAFDADNRYTPPYPAWVYGVVYVSAIEPTVAAFVLAGLCWRHLRGGKVARTAKFCLILCLIRGRVGLFLLDSWHVDVPSLAMRFASTSQFLLETAVLGILVCVVWDRLASDLAGAPWTRAGTGG